MTLPNFLIFGMPRTGTTILINHVAHHYNINNQKELFGPKGTVGPTILSTFGKARAPFVGKILIDQITEDIDQIINQLNIGTIIVTTRENLTDCCVSSHVAAVTSKYHYSVGDNVVPMEPILVHDEHVDYWIKNVYLPYLQVLDKWHDRPYNVVKYEDITNNNPIIINGEQLTNYDRPFQPSNFDYKKICINYEEIQQKIRNATC